MNPKELLLEACKAAGFEAWRGRYGGKKPPPDVYGVFTGLTVPGDSADDEMLDQERYFYLSLYTRGDSTALCAALREEMEERGFITLEERDVAGTSEDAAYCVAFTFYCVEDLGDGN